MNDWRAEQMMGRARAVEIVSETPLPPFRSGDPGKHVQTLLPTPEWKTLTKEANRRGVSLSLMLRVAIRHHMAWLEPPDLEENGR